MTVRYLRVAVASAVLQIKGLAIQPYIVFFLVGHPFVVATIGFSMIQGRNDIDPIFVVVGTSLTGLLTGFVFLGGTQLINERHFGTLEILEAAPAPLFVVITGRIAGSLGLTFLSGIVSWGVCAGLFGYSVRIVDPLGFLLSILLAIASLWALGMVFTPLFFLWPSANQVLGGLEYPIYIVGGFLFPVTLLPEWLRLAGYLLPPYWAAAALHGTSSGGLDAEDLRLAWLILSLAALIFLTISVTVFEKALWHARKEGRIGWV